MRFSPLTGRILVAAGAAVLLVLAAQEGGATPAGAQTAASPSSAVRAPVFSPGINLVGAVNFTTLAAQERGAKAAVAGAASGSNYRAVDNQLLSHVPGHALTAPDSGKSP
jgi:hypothetical protein